jgi:hypothetical protein
MDQYNRGISFYCGSGHLAQIVLYPSCTGNYGIMELQKFLPCYHHWRLPQLTHLLAHLRAL